MKETKLSSKQVYRKSIERYANFHTFIKQTMYLSPCRAEANSVPVPLFAPKNKNPLR